MKIKMKMWGVPNFPEELRRQMAAAARIKGITVSELVAQLCRNYLDSESIFPKKKINQSKNEKEDVK